VIHHSTDANISFYQGIVFVPLLILAAAVVVRQIKMWRKWYSRRTAPQKVGMALMILGAKMCRAPFVKYTEFNGRRWISFDTPEFKLPDPGSQRNEGLEWLTRP
jgi:hypothetical protein